MAIVLTTIVCSKTYVHEMEEELYSNKVYKSGNKKGQRIAFSTLNNLKLGRMTDNQYEETKSKQGRKAATRRVKCSTRNCNKYSLRPKGSKYRCYFHKQQMRKDVAREWARRSRLRTTLIQSLRKLMPEIVEQVIKAYERKLHG